MNLADELGVRVRGVQGYLATNLRRFQPGGHTGTGLGLPVLRGSGIPKIPRVQIARAVGSKLQLPPVGTSPTPGKLAAPHPRIPTTQIALSRGFRDIRRGQ